MDQFLLKDSVLEKYTGCESKVVIPEGITEIGKGAFSRNDNIEEVIIPKGVLKIGDSAFCCCINLKNLVIPDTVYYIGDEALWGCKSLKKLIIPKSVTSIGYYPFEGCGLEEIIVDENNEKFFSFDGVLYFDKKNADLCYCPKEKNSIVFPPNVKSISDSSFDGCYKLTEIIIPNTVTDIDIDAFFNCKNLKKVYIPDSVKNIENDIFFGCDSLEEITVGENNEEYSSYDGVMYNKEQTELVYCPIGKKKITIPKSVDDPFDGYYGFKYCVNLEEIKAPQELDLSECNVPKECKIIRY